MTAATPRANERILIACVGNIFFGDDAFGVEVARRLAFRTFPAGVTLIDFGIRGMDLAYALLEAYDAVILVDAVPRGGNPGSLYLLEVDPSQHVAAAGEAVEVDAHSMDPLKVLRFASTMGAVCPRIMVVGCEPMLPESDMTMGLSDPVFAAVDAAVEMVDNLVARLLTEPARVPASPMHA